MWELVSTPMPTGLRCRILAGSEQLTFRALFAALANDEHFADWYSDVLASVSMPAYFWEHPRLCATGLDAPLEFALVESSSLARLHPDPQPFAERFARRADAEVVRFANLGGDALLVAPAPVTARAAYPHLAAFLRSAPKRQVRVLWRVTALAVLETVAQRPTWLSTAGMGVPWLHVRLDTHPKYYRFAPYKTGA